LIVCTYGLLLIVAAILRKVGIGEQSTPTA